MNTVQIFKKFCIRVSSQVSNFFSQLLYLAPFMKKILNDKNAAALEKGLDVVLVWVDRYEHATKYGVLNRNFQQSNTIFSLVFTY